MRAPAASILASILFVTPVLPQAASPPAADRSVELAISASWVHPNLDPVFDAYTGFEQGLGLRRWRNDGIRYGVNAEARYHVMSDHQVVLEGSASATYRKWGTDASMTGLYRAGAGYRVGVLSVPVDVAVLATIGAQWVNFSRSYNDDRLEINDKKAGFYASAGASVGMTLIRNFALEGSLRYFLVPSLQLDALHTSVKPGGLAGSVGFVVTL